MDKKKDLLMDHEYDGIQELDNDLPPWWLNLFYITILFSFVYLMYFHVLGMGDLQEAELYKEYDPSWTSGKQTASVLGEYSSPYASPKGEITPYIEAQFSSYIGPEVPVEALIVEAMRRSDTEMLDKLKAAFPVYYEKLISGEGPLDPKAGGAVAAADLSPVEALTDEASLAEGKDIFIKNCASCHGMSGEGGVGPNMTDDYWIHGAEMNQMIKIVNEGVIAKGMIPWRGTLSDDKILKVSSYIKTIRGTNPPNGKAPQGEKVEISL